MGKLLPIWPTWVRWTPSTIQNQTEMISFVSKCQLGVCESDQANLLADVTSVKCKRCSVAKKNRRRLTAFRFKTSQSLSTLSLIYSFLILNLVVIPSLVEISSVRTSVALRHASACHPGGPGGNRPIPRKIKPIVFRQHVPNVSEKTIGASGPSEGKIIKTSKRYREDLVINLNPSIVFKDEEQTNADRMMTRRCRDSLNRLATMVSVYWKGETGLRVTEAWDEDGAHEPDSLHYEGRAVDITTTDKDRTKYGILARLAVEAGFDWVFYESRAHVHCSVKSEKSDAARYGGCFSGDSTAMRPDGSRVKMSDLAPGDLVLALDSGGNIVEDRVLTFMDRQLPSTSLRGELRHNFMKIHTDAGTAIQVTGNHLIYTLPHTSATEYSPNNGSFKWMHLSQAVYARNIEMGDYVIVTHPLEECDIGGSVLERRGTKLSRVVSVTAEVSNAGAFAPLTAAGTILVDGVAASCYAVLNSHSVAHWVMTPLRYYHIFQNWLQHTAQPTSLNRTTHTPSPPQDAGVHMYSRIWYNIGAVLLPESVFAGV